MPAFRVQRTPPTPRPQPTENPATLRQLEAQQAAANRTLAACEGDVEAQRKMTAGQRQERLQACRVRDYNDRVRAPLGQGAPSQVPSEKR